MCSIFDYITRQRIATIAFVHHPPLRVLLGCNSTRNENKQHFRLNYIGRIPYYECNTRLRQCEVRQEKKLVFRIWWVHEHTVTATTHTHTPLRTSPPPTHTPSTHTDVTARSFRAFSISTLAHTVPKADWKINTIFEMCMFLLFFLSKILKVKRK